MPFCVIYSLGFSTVTFLNSLLGRQTNKQTNKQKTNPKTNYLLIFVDVNTALGPIFNISVHHQGMYS